MNKTYTTSLILILTVASVFALNTADPLANAKRVVACLLMLAKDISPYILLSFLLIGGIIYILAADDRKQRLLGKKYMVMGVIGFILIWALILIAAQPPFYIPLRICTIPDGTTWNPLARGWSLTRPGDDTTMTILAPIIDKLS